MILLNRNLIRRHTCVFSESTSVVKISCASCALRNLSQDCARRGDENDRRICIVCDASAASDTTRVNAASSTRQMPEEYMRIMATMAADAAENSAILFNF